MSFEIEGIVKELGDEQSFNEGAFIKKEHLVEVQDGAYTQLIPVTVSQKNLGLFDAANVGDKVKVDINLRSNEYNGKHYVSVNGWRLAIVEKGVVDSSDQTINVSDGEQSTTTVDPVNEEETDLPF